MRDTIEHLGLNGRDARIGLLGGSFNPIHEGHLAMAQAALDELSLSRLILMPDGDPPHKAAELADKRDRLRMAELAAAGRFEVSAMEVERPGKTYTVDTLEVLRTLYPQAQLIMIIGADTLHDLHAWKNAARVFQLCQFAVFARDDLPLIEVPGATVLRMKTPICDVSATEIRARVHKGLSLEGFTPPAVERYIGQQRLYDPPAEMSEKALRKALRETLPAQRYAHTIGVVGMMEALAERWGYDRRKAVLTGLLHDCSKGMTLEAMQRFVTASGVQVDPMRMESIALLHGPASMAMARMTYGVTEPDILAAIRYHNTGRIPMDTLDKLLCVADMAEPGRKERDWMPALRALSQEDLTRAAAETLRIKLAYLNGHHKYVHPDTAAAYAAMIAEMEREGT